MRSGTLGLLFDLLKVPFVVGTPFLVANRGGDDARSDWDPHYGDTEAPGAEGEADDGGVEGR